MELTFFQKIIWWGKKDKETFVKNKENSLTGLLWESTWRKNKYDWKAVKMLQKKGILQVKGLKIKKEKNYQKTDEKIIKSRIL